MAYPFTPLPSFTDFKSTIQKKFGCKFKTENDGMPFPIQYFERIIKGKSVKCAVYFENEKDILTPSVLRSICTRLEIDPSYFGLHLG